MPLTEFICPDGVHVPIKSCLANCRMGRRCLTLPTLRVIAGSSRSWTGTPSTTQLLNGTMLAYLLITKPYAIRPKDQAFSLLGSSHHALLSEAAASGSEEQLAAAITGTPDLFEPDEESPGQHILTDYKTYGSYRVARVLGIKYRYEHRGEVYQTNSRWGRAGQPRKTKVFYTDPGAADMEDEKLQLNHYRYLLESRGYSISRMQLQITVRDGGLLAARERGIDDVMYLVEVPKIDDALLMNFFRSKAESLLYAVTRGWSQPCTDKEAWGGTRCKRYCPVAEHCPRGQVELAKQENS